MKIAVCFSKANVHVYCQMLNMRFFTVDSPEIKKYTGLDDNETILSWSLLFIVYNTKRQKREGKKPCPKNAQMKRCINLNLKTFKPFEIQPMHNKKFIF